MKGLEITEFLLSEFMRENDFLRLDSEFNLKEPLAVVRALRAAGAKRFGDSSPTIIHPHEITREYVEEGGVWFFRAQNLRPLAIADSDKVFVSEEDAATLEKNRIQNGDVVITRTGANAGDCALFFSDEPAVASSHTFIVRSQAWSHAYLVAFFNSHYGRTQILKGRYGAAQPEVAPYYLRGIWIPRFSSDFDRQIERQFESSWRQKKIANAQLAAAEQTLLHALGLDNWRPPEPLTYVRRASEVAEAARFDAEFFTPRTRQLLAKLGEGGRSIRDVAPPRHEEFRAAGGPGEFDYIEIGSLRSDGTADSEHLACADAPSRATWHVRGGDVVTSTVRPNRRLSALISSEQSGFVASSGFVVLQPQALSTEVLLTYLRLPPVCEVMDLHTSASLYPTISETDLLRLPFPTLDANVCADITIAVQAAHAARREAQSLLARAQRAVEVAIDQGEFAAMAFLHI